MQRITRWVVNAWRWALGGLLSALAFTVILLMTVFLSGCGNPLNDVSSDDLRRAEQTFYTMANDVERIADRLESKGCK